PEALTDAPVAAISAETGRDQVADPRQAIKCFDLGPEGDPQPRDLDDPAGDQGRLCVVAVAQPIADARGDGDHVLEGRRQFDSDEVMARVDAETVGREQLLHFAKELIVVARDDNTGRQTAGELLRVARSAEGHDLTLPEDIANDPAGSGKRVVL